ncbi:hypothetical protein [Desertivirga brevis]|uniref:hypothetical protein n=1 Tax=Desertivirga brevis TaxID=2810310 RepID=UPI001A960B7B|nr:hypothetical protein [Pedobacter sp. SYSU D00873]
MKLYEVFSLPEADWKVVIAKVLNLSETIDIAIWDLWIKFEKKKYEYTIEDYASDFIDQYYKEDSRVDVWQSEEQLELAKRRIVEYNDMKVSR